MSFHHKRPDIEDVKKKINVNATVVQAGKVINWKKFTQENNKDLDIYEVREKYDGQYANRLKYDPEIEKAEIDHTMTLDKVYERNKALKNQWLNLPLEVRKEFDNDINNFTDNGQKWLNEKVEKIVKERQAREAEIRKREEERQKKLKEEEQNNG